MAGLSPRETQILDLYDNHHSPRAIARETGIAYSQVNNVIKCYGYSGPNVHARAAMIRCSQRLLAAITKARQVQEQAA